MKRLTHASLAIAALLAGLAGCETTKMPETTALAPVETRNPLASNTAAAGANTAPTAQSSVASVDLSKGAGTAAAGSTALTSLPSQRIVYFDFDSFVIKDDYKPVLEGYGKTLAGNRGKKMVIEGHTDERGGREYNLALGQKRAAAVVRTLALLGATESQLEAVSFGEERPAANGSDESAWSKNRRAELKDR